MAPNEFRSVEELLPLIGEYGRYQKLLDLVFSFFNLPIAMQILMMTFATITPSWRCQDNNNNNTECVANSSVIFPPTDEKRCEYNRTSWEYIEVKEFSLVTQFNIDCNDKWILQLLPSIFFVGWGIGSFVLGFIGDKFGRKFLLFPCTFVLILIGFVSSFLTNIYLIIASRFLIGFCVFGTTTQAYILISEVVGSKQRPFACNIIFLFTSIGWGLLALQAYLLKNWKTLSIVSSAPYILLLFTYKFVPESVQFLQSKGRHEEVMEVISTIAQWNNKTLPDDVKLLNSNTTEEQQPPQESSPDIFGQLTPKLVIESLQQGYIWMVVAMGYYGLYSATDDLGGSVYRDFVLLNLVDIPALFLAMYMLERIGRKYSTIVPMLLGGIACIIVGFIPRQGSYKVGRIIMGSIGKFFLGFGFNGIYTWSVELYPTRVRSLGMGFTNVCSRIGSAAAPWIAKGLQPVAPWLPFVALGVPSMVAFFVGLFLPETKENVSKVHDFSQSKSSEIVNDGCSGEAEEITDEKVATD